MRFVFLFMCHFVCLHSFVAPSEFKVKGNKALTIFLTANDGAKVAQDLAGLGDTYFYSVALSVKQESAVNYNQDIAAKILLINKHIRSLAKGAGSAADFISTTLTEMSAAVNQLIIDSSVNASLSVIQADLVQIQSVVNAFNAGFALTLSTPPDKIIDKAEVALQAFADLMEAYIFQLNLLVYQSSGNQALVVCVPSFCHFDQRESSRDSTIATGSILTIWTQLRSIESQGFDAVKNAENLVHRLLVSSNYLLVLKMKQFVEYSAIAATLGNL